MLDIKKKTVKPLIDLSIHFLANVLFLNQTKHFSEHSSERFSERTSGILANNSILFVSSFLPSRAEPSQTFLSIEIGFYLDSSLGLLSMLFDIFVKKNLFRQAFTS